MHSESLQKQLLRMFSAFDVELEPDEDWLVTDGDFPAIKASWHPGDAGRPGRLDIDVVLSEERQIEESFAGIGEGDAGCREALAAFERISFPVLLAGCWYVTDTRKLKVETLEIGVRSWDIFIGPFDSTGGLPALPSEALAGVLDALKRESLSAQLHWIRLFVIRGNDGINQFEALLDNQPWAGGEQALRGATWPDGSYNAHGFLLLDVHDY